MLIHSTRLKFGDFERWLKNEEIDALNTWCPSPYKIRKSVEAMERFVAQGPAYLGVSWGKDSVAVAHLALDHGIDVPLVCIRVEPINNPEIWPVRDAFLERHPRANYHEIRIDCRCDEFGPHATGTLEAGFKIARRRFGKRHISGVRAQESGIRKMRCRTYGESSPNTCAPLAWWTTQDVFSYSYREELPLCAAYAMTGGRQPIFPRDKLRVAFLTLELAKAYGSEQWERLYFGDYLKEINAW